MKTKSIYFGLALLSLLFVYHISDADACFVPKMVKKLPNIPTQRALVKYRGGTETLIIESTLDGNGRDYGWIIPVPNQPKKIEKVSPGFLKTLSLQLQPKIHYQPHPKPFDIYIYTLYTFLVLIACFIFMRWGAKRSILPLILIVFFMIWFPNIYSYWDSPTGPESSLLMDPFVKTKSREVVGNYDIFILEVRDSSELNSWLDRNGLSHFPPKATGIIDDYIAQGWYFTVAKLNTDSVGIATPHPLLLTFESDRPVYPMKLTALAGSNVYLELFVVSDQEAVPINYDITKEYCNYFDYNQIPASDFHSESSGSKRFVPRKFFKIHQEIAHSDAFEMLWDGCVVTKIADTVTSNDMKADMFFRFKEAVPFQKQLYTPKAKFDKAYFNTLWLTSIGAILLTISYRLIRKRWNIPGMAVVWLLLLISCAAVFISTYVSLEETSDFYAVKTSLRKGSSIGITYLFAFPEKRPSNGEELIDFLNRKGIVNDITKEPIILEDSPGNIVVEQTGNKYNVKLCLENGSLKYLMTIPDFGDEYDTPPKMQKGKDYATGYHDI